MRKYSVAIDGPSGAGKSTMARAAAEHFGFIYVDTGAIYRTLGHAAIEKQILLQDENEINALLASVSINIAYGSDGVQKMILNGTDVSDKIRTPEISLAASKISAYPSVRLFLLDMQRDMAKENSVVMDGRDIGTVVLPNADIKIFLTASPEVRASRRYAELLAKGTDISYERVLAEIIERDTNDSSRKTAPLKMASGAILLDTGNLTLEESKKKIIELIESRLEGYSD
ncbi:MAG: (d)CMP kinase [Ruminococcaceae bacterium]|nr:(d)CMP kinase [Oscillospiraceae bacterium]